MNLNLISCFVFLWLFIRDAAFVGNLAQIFLTNMLINDEFALFLLPCRMRHPDGSGQLLGGRSGRRGGSLGDAANMLMEPGAVAGSGADSATGVSSAWLGGSIEGFGITGSGIHSGGNGGSSGVCREFVLEAFVLPLRTMFAESLSAYALPALESERLHCVLDLDKTLLVSVR